MANTITSADVARCPHRILTARHYRSDGSCYCQPTLDSHPDDHTICSRCQGTGRVIDADTGEPTKCPICKGEGVQ